MRKGTWFVVLDRKKGRLLRATRTRRGSPHLEEHGVIEDRWEEHEHRRPSRRTGKSTNSYASWKNEADERIRRYVKDVGSWLDRELESRRIERFVLFAPEVVLGSLRKAMPPRLVGKAVQATGEFAHLPLSELAQEPAVLSFLAEGSGA